MTFGLSYRRMRWEIAGWLTLSTVLNLIDRQTLSILAPLLRAQFSMSVQDYANVVAGFPVSYTAMYAGGGRLVDKIGERRRVVGWLAGDLPDACGVSRHYAPGTERA